MPCAAARISTITRMAVVPNPKNERGIWLFFIWPQVTPGFYILDKIRLNLFKSIHGFNIFP